MSLANNQRRCTLHGLPGRQRGMSMWMMMVMAGAAAFLGLFAFKVGPHYMSNMTVKSVAEQLVENPDVMRMPRSRVLSWVDQQYRTNNLWDYKAEETIVLQKSGKHGYLVTVQYEQRANLFHNIDLVTRFDTIINGDS